MRTSTTCYEGVCWELPENKTIDYRVALAVTLFAVTVVALGVLAAYGASSSDTVLELLQNPTFFY